MNHSILLLTIVLIAFPATGCDDRESISRNAAPPATVPTKSMKPKAEVKVLMDGSLFLDGQPSTLAMIDQRFAELAKSKGELWYYREAAQAEPPAVAIKIIDLAIKYQLPITMSSKPDFSDAVDEKGVSHPVRTRE
jgi:biopolymer transport protein ExbD